MRRSTELQRFLDFWVGVPLVMLLRPLRRHRTLPSEPKRIGVIAPTAIGDLILSSGVLLRLQETFPRAEIHLFHGASNAGILPLLPVRVVPHVCVFSRIRKTIKEIRDSDLGVCVDLTPWPRLTALYAIASGAVTVGFCAERQYRHFAFDMFAQHLSSRHETKNLAALADVFSKHPSYSVKLDSPTKAPELGIDWASCVLCHVCAGGRRAREKAWPIANWIEVTRKFVADGYSVGFTGSGPDRAVIDGLLKEAGLPNNAAFSLCDRLGLEELAGALSACRMCVSVDTGVMHLASAVGAPLVALFGASHSRRWGALSKTSVNLDAPHRDSGFVHFGFETSASGEEIMQTLRVEDVYSAIESLLAKTRHGHDIRHGSPAGLARL